MREILIALLLLSSISGIYAQDSTSSYIKLKEDKFSLNLLINPAIHYETKIAEQKSLKFGLGLTTIIGKDGNEIGTASFFSTAYRIYYENSDPELSYNSGSYYGAKGKIILDARDIEGSLFTPDKAIQINGIWGFQDNYEGGFYWGGTIGPGITINTDYSIKFSPLFDLQLGFNL
ncbi:MAG: hypothetical protein MK086_06435 [Flavobacteriales bacterium]|nr:hypothetical protein [Flavobacteriales bacterium]